VTSLALQLALHGSIVLLSGLVGGLFFARAITMHRGEVAWRVVHAGGSSAGAMLLAIAAPSQWVALGASLKITMAVSLIAGTYILCLGMYIAAIWDTRGIPGGRSPLNRAVYGLYALGAVMTLFGGALLTVGLIRKAFESAVT